MEANVFAQMLAKVEVGSVLPASTTDCLPHGALVVGCIQMAHCGEPDNSVVILAHKTMGFSTFTDCCIQANDATFADWPVWHLRPLPPTEALKAIALVVEDVSPDSVWGIIVLLARLAGCDLAGTLRDWLPAIQHWELSGNADDPRSEWPALASSLGHASFGAGLAELPRDYREAWSNLLRFAGDCLVRSRGPKQLGEHTDWPLLRRARLAIEQEQQAYHDWLSHAHLTQLSLPMRGASDRRLLVDALLFAEDQVTGSAKVLYRNDRETAPLKLGFSLAAHHRPAAGAGSGDDFTITVDERRGVHLRDLWQELERRETAAWTALGEARPNWKLGGIGIAPVSWTVSGLVRVGSS